MKVNMEERLPQVVEDRLKEAYEQIRRGEIKQMNKVTDPDWEASRKERKTDGRKRKTGSFRRGLGGSSACAGDHYSFRSLCGGNVFQEKCEGRGKQYHL